MQLCSLQFETSENPRTHDALQIWYVTRDHAGVTGSGETNQVSPAYIMQIGVEFRIFPERQSGKPITGTLAAFGTPTVAWRLG